MRVLITGATGFVGKNLVNKLLEQGDKIIVLVRNPDRIPREWIGKVQVIVSDLDSIATLKFDEMNIGDIDIFFHFAWNGTSGTERSNINLQLANIQYTCDAVRMAATLNCRKFVNAGSIMEYEAMAYIPKDGAIPGAGCIYSVAKLTADFMAKIIANQEKVSYINIIISNIYGEGETSDRFLNSSLRKMLDNEDIPLTHGNQLYDFIHIEDAVRAIALVAEKGVENTSYYIGNEKQRPLKEFVDEMYNLLKSQSRLGYGEISFHGPRMSYDELDTGALKRMGFLPQVSFAEGILRMRDWIVRGKSEY